jgi:multidrug efflux pump subunit AcrA (membrane-fusion protein)
VEQNVTLFDVVIQVANVDLNLKSGMNTTVEIVIFDEPDVLTIPVAALRTDRADPGGTQPGGSTAAVLVKQGEDYVERKIRTGRSDRRVIEVLEGLADDAVLGIPMVSRLKEENDLLNARMRERRSFGSSDRDRQKPSDKRG